MVGVSRISSIVVALAVATVAAACAPAPPVEVERSEASSTGPLVPDGRAGNPSIGEMPSPGPDVPPAIPAPETSLSWGSCEDVGIPPSSQLGTQRWECATLAAPMDPFGDDPAVVGVDVELALTRHPATGNRRGAIVVNPGGPGGSGLATAWNLRGAMPADLLRSFDIVSWDPRGVGASVPKIDCDDAIGPGAPGFIAACVEATGVVSGFLTAPYSAADLEAIRVALGEATLDYLGYSYGSILGALYAEAHPDRVGSFVLDGVTDPLTGSADGPFEDGFAVLADDGVDEARRRFAELCDSTERCLAGRDATDVIDGLPAVVGGLPTADHDGVPDVVRAGDYELLVDASMSFAGDWELLATGLADADAGDASTLAALVAEQTDLDGDGDGDDAGGDGDDDDSSADDPTMGESDFAEANFMIYCADLGTWITEWSFCDGMARAPRQLSPVAAVELERPVLVIGTEFDPLTPGYHAPEFAAALDDAVHVIWEGVGHTAFPGWTPCIDDAVSDHFLRRSVPTDGTRCSFLLDVDDDTLLADELFGHGDLESARQLEDVVSARLDDDTADCVALELNRDDDRVISHVLVGVTSSEAVASFDDALGSC